MCLQSMDEWSYLSQLLHSGYPFLDALAFLGKDMGPLQAALAQGVPLQKALLTISSGRFQEHLRFFLQITSLEAAIDSALKMQVFEKRLQKQLVRNCAYPCFIFLFAYGMLLFFTNAIIPQMLETFVMEDANGLIVLLTGIRILCQIVALLVVVGIIALLYLRKHPQVRCHLLSRLNTHIHVIADYVSYQFAGYLLELEKQGISTVQALQYLMEIKADTMVHEAIQHIQQRLVSGGELLCILQTEELLNKAFQTTFRIGASTGALVDMLPGFLLQQEHTWQRQVKKLSWLMQGIAYSFVALIVLLVYQIMLIPLSMLEQM